jgi:hypothetical protein
MARMARSGLVDTATAPRRIPLHASDLDRDRGSIVQSPFTLTVASHHRFLPKPPPFFPQSRAKSHALPELTLYESRIF